MTQLATKLKFIYKGANTHRFHTADTLTKQTVGQHSFGVAWLVLLLAPSARKELICAALAHDLAEHIVGDVASPAKRRFPDLAVAVSKAEGVLLNNMGLDWEGGLTDHELRILKLADMLDGMMFCVRERRMGSKVVKEIYDNFYSYIKELISVNNAGWFAKEYQELIEEINNMWEKYDGSK